MRLAKIGVPSRALTTGEILALLTLHCYADGIEQCRTRYAHGFEQLKNTGLIHHRGPGHDEWEVSDAGRVYIEAISRVQVAPSYVAHLPQDPQR